MKVFAGRTSKWAVGVFCALAVVVLCAALVIGTARGRQGLLDAISHAVQSPDFQLKMHGLGLGTTCTLERLAIGDSAGTWLLAEGISVRPVFVRLLSGHISLDHLGVKNIDLERLPEGQGEPSGPPALPELRMRAVDAPHIRLGKDVLGREALLAIRGKLLLTDDESRAVLEAFRLDRPEDRLDLDGIFQRREETLNLALDLHEAPDGLLHALLGVNGTEGITVKAQGRGPVTAWPLTMSARVGNVAGLNATATLAMSAAPEVTVEATLTPGPGWAGLTGLPDQPIRLTSRAAWETPVLHIIGLNAETAAAFVSSDADWNTRTGSLNATARAQGRDLAPLLPSGMIPGQSLLDADISLTRKGLRARADIRLKEWDISGHAVPTARARANLELPPSRESWYVNATVDAGIPSLPEGLRTWTADAALSGTRDKALLKRLRMATRLVYIEAEGDVDSTMALNLRAKVRPAPDLSPSALLAAGLKGRIDPAMAGLSGALDVNATDISGLPAPFGEFLGRELRCTTDFSLTPQGLRLRGAEATGPGQVHLDGEWDFASSRFQTMFRSTWPQARLNGISLPPQTRLGGQASGTLDSFKADLQAQCGTFNTAGIDVAGLEIRGRAKDLPRSISGLIDARARLNGEPVELNLNAAWGDGHLDLTDCTLRLPETELAGDMVLDPAGPIITGGLKAESRDLQALGRILGTTVGGSLTLEADLAEMDGRQGVNLEARASGLGISGAAAERVEARGRLVFPNPLEKADLETTLRNVQWAGISQDRVDARLLGSANGLGVEVALKDDASQLALRLRGRLATSLDRLVVDDVRGTLFQLPVGMHSPLDLQLEASGVNWPETALTLGPARLQSRGSLSRERLDITASLDRLNPAMLRQRYPSLPEADVSADLRVQGTVHNPDARLRVRAGKIRFEDTGLASLPTMEASAECLFQNSTLRAEGNLAAGDVVSLAADFAAPVNTGPDAAGLAPETPLTGRVQGRTSLSLITHVLRRDDQTLEGDCDIDYRIGGIWSEPSLTGQATVRGARYENFRSGTVIADIGAVARAQGSIITAEASGTDGHEGRVRAQGQMDLTGLAYSVDADVEAFRLLRTDLVRGVAAGTAQLRGSADTDMTLEGSLTLDPTQVRLPSNVSGEAPDIEVREINTNASHAAAPERKSPFPLHLDLAVMIPARLTVQGRGLDSEWSGKFHMGGTQIEPVIRGEANLLRGKLDFLDRTFDLTKGILVFSGETPPNPFLDIIGEVSVLDAMIQVNLTGPARSPRLTLTSIPSLPQDELLSMILFGRSMREIAPLQAVRLAQAAAEMTGLGGVGPGFLQSVKSKLGLQELEVSRDEDDNTAVGIGGYIGGKYYFRTRSSVSGQDKTKVEVQLTPDISVETEVGSDSRQGGGINWKHDY